MKVKRILKWTGTIVLLVLILWGFVAYWRSTNDCDRKAGTPSNPMKAIRYCEYGSPDVLKLEEIEKPVPNDGEVLVRVRAASLNALEASVIRDLWVIRLMSGLRKPKITRFGRDFAGVVEAVGKSVTEFKAGDEVFGVKWGAVAEYVCVLEQRAIVSKPANISFEQAGAVGVAGLTALQGLRNAGKIHAGQKVLINGASGGVGTFAVQIAKAFGTEVTAVCSTRNAEMARSLGADHVIDYTKEDFIKANQRYDVLFDNVGNRSFSERRQILKPHGMCVLAGIGSMGANDDSMSRIAGTFTASLRSRFIDQKFERYTTTMNKGDLTFLRDLMAEGKLTPVVEKTYPVSETAEAVRYFQQGHVRGKIVINVTSNPPSHQATARQGQ
jgi:NADPH:quinone reductase-like Zn-dependent oxidoreductase